MGIEEIKSLEDWLCLPLHCCAPNLNMRQFKGKERLTCPTDLARDVAGVCSPVKERWGLICQQP